MLTVDPRKKREITEVVKSDKGVELFSESGKLRILPIREDIFRISYTEEDEFGRKQGDQFAGPVEGLYWSIQEAEEYILIQTEKVSARVDRQTGSICYIDTDGKMLFSEAAKESKQVESFDSYKTIEDPSAQVEEVQTADGLKRRVKAAAKEFYRKLYHTKLEFCLDEDEIVFGLGQSPDGIWNVRGTTQYLHQANMKSPIPVLLSSKQYGIMLSTKSTSIFSDTKLGTYWTTQADEYLDYYFIAGSAKTVVNAMRYLSGQAAMLPKWAFGYIQSQERYESREEILATAKAFQEKGFPVSALVLDWLSWPDGLWGQKSFDEKRFPNALEMTDILREMGIHLMVSIWPNMDGKSPNHKEFKEAGLCLPNSNLYNSFEEKGRELYWKQAYEGLFSKGVDGWWQDSSEPITPEWMHGKEPDPASAYFEFVTEGTKIMPEDRLNYFCIGHGQALYEGQTAVSEKRVLNLTRSGYPGSQKYGAVVWSGDIAASWDTLRKQVVAGISYVATGMPYWNLDIGAFFIKKGNQWYWNGDYDLGEKDPDYLELYTRWYQFATFLPMMRAHGTDIRREPWNIAPEGTDTYRQLLNSAKLRYQLMPYIYSLAMQCCMEGTSIISPLCYAFPNDAKCYEVQDEFMLGENMLICPVVEPDKISHGIRKIYLPEGKVWYDYSNGDKYEGGQEIFYELTMERIPVFVAAGSCIPMAVSMEDGTEAISRCGEKLYLRVYKGESFAQRLYNDAGDGYDYKNGDYTESLITYSEETQTAEISYSGKEEYRLVFSEIEYWD